VQKSLEDLFETIKLIAQQHNAREPDSKKHFPPFHDLKFLRFSAFNSKSKSHPTYEGITRKDFRLYFRSEGNEDIEWVDLLAKQKVFCEAKISHPIYVSTNFTNAFDSVPDSDYDFGWWGREHFVLIRQHLAFEIESLPGYKDKRTGAELMDVSIERRKRSTIIGLLGGLESDTLLLEFITFDGKTHQTHLNSLTSRCQDLILILFVKDHTISTRNMKADKKWRKRLTRLLYILGYLMILEHNINPRIVPLTLHTKLTESFDQMGTVAFEDFLKDNSFASILESNSLWDVLDIFLKTHDKDEDVKALAMDVLESIRKHMMTPAGYQVIIPSSLTRTGITI
jgi:hypothetical protein